MAEELPVHRATERNRAFRRLYLRTCLVEEANTREEDKRYLSLKLIIGYISVIQSFRRDPKTRTDPAFEAMYSFDEYAVKNGFSETEIHYLKARAGRMVQQIKKFELATVAAYSMQKTDRD